MARKTTEAQSASPGPAILATSRVSAREQIVSRLSIGADLVALEPKSIEQLEDFQRQFDKWTAYNLEMVRRMFSTEEYAAQYTRAYPATVMVTRDQQFHEKVGRLRLRVKHKIDFLESLAERLDLIAEPISEAGAYPAPLIIAGPAGPAGPPGPPGLEVQAPKARRQQSNRDIFVVHGRDEEMKSVVARFLEKCELKPIILAEQPDQGRTIIEKFEASADVSFAVVLLSPDDVGGLAPENGKQATLTNRARQNVILELGYFVGRLGRASVCALKKGDVEIPSDFSGVVYTPYTADEAWKLKLAREIKASGIAVDMNVALS